MHPLAVKYIPRLIKFGISKAGVMNIFIILTVPDSYVLFFVLFCFVFTGRCNRYQTCGTLTPNYILLEGVFLMEKRYIIKNAEG